MIPDMTEPEDDILPLLSGVYSDLEQAEEFFGESV